MRIGVPREADDQPLVAATPDTTGALVRLGHEVLVEAGAGESAHHPDGEYTAAGATIVDEGGAWGADLVTTLDAPTPAHLALMHPGAVLVARLAPARHPELIEDLRAAGVTALALDAVPRISRAQSLDVLSSQANIAGYRAVIEAAGAFGRVFTGQVTAAGKMPPADVYVIGAGVAGLAALGTAVSLGAQVAATDVRPEVAEQVASMGARFVPLPVAEQNSTDGYARALSEDQEEAARRLYAEQAAHSDIVITTANIPGRRAPLLLDETALAGMRPGSVVVDMAACNGGNTALTVPGEVVTTPGGVTVIGYNDLAARLPAQASQLYGRNVVNLLSLMTPGKDGHLVLDLDDQVIRAITVTTAGEVLWPPPPISVSAAVPAGAAGAGGATGAGSPSSTGGGLPGAGPEAGAGDLPGGVGDPVAHAAAVAEEARSEARRRRRRLAWWALAGLVAAALVLSTPPAAAAHLMVLLLAVVVGFRVITAVTHSLHTPLMSVTNAVSGIILVGAVLQVGSSDTLVSALAFVAIVVASINIFGGFTVTHRMLAMFRKD